MLFDTGSCEFWIPSKECSTKRCLTHTRYTQSKTFAPYKNAKIAIQYLSGKVTGDMAKETIGLGGLIIPGQIIGIAKEVEIPLLDVIFLIIFIFTIGSYMGWYTRACLSK